MEVILVLGAVLALVLLDVLAVRRGFESREGLANPAWDAHGYL